MYSKWIEEFKGISHKFLFISKLGVSLLTVFTFLSLYDWFRYYTTYPNFFIENWEMSETFKQALVFQLFIALIFLARFSLLFFSKEKIYFFRVALYLIGLSLLVSYFLISPHIIPGVSYTYHDTDFFIFASKSFNIIAIFYLVLSPLIKIILGVIAFTESK